MRGLLSMSCRYVAVLKRFWFLLTEEVKKIVSHYQQLWSENAIKSAMLRAMIDNLTSHVHVSDDYQADLLLSDYHRHTEYRPLLSRTTCSSLEDRKEYFAKRRKLDSYLTSTADEKAARQNNSVEDDVTLTD